MKKKFDAPVFEMIRFNAEDVITTSGTIEIEFSGDDMDLDDCGVDVP